MGLARGGGVVPEEVVVEKVVVAEEGVVADLVEAEEVVVEKEGVVANLVEAEEVVVLSYWLSPAATSLMI